MHQMILACTACDDIQKKDADKVAVRRKKRQYECCNEIQKNLSRLRPFDCIIQIVLLNMPMDSFRFASPDTLTLILEEHVVFPRTP